MKVHDVCTKTVRSIGPADTIGHAAKLMARDDVGALPVMSDGSLVGIVTDRDLVLRGLATGMSIHAPVRRVMTVDVVSCSPGDELNDALEVMSSERVRRLPVRTNSGELVGMVSLADAVAVGSRRREAADALAEICARADVPCRVPMFA